jgi:PTH2 family peptidyl-tRNA hydrolase
VEKNKLTHKQVIVIRKDLNMRKGKMVAQGAHASMAAILSIAVLSDTGLNIPNDPRIQDWLRGKFTKVCVSVNSENELLALHEQAKVAGLLTALIQDSGLTEFGGVATYTAVAIGPDLKSTVDSITGNLPLL